MEVTMLSIEDYFLAPDGRPLEAEPLAFYEVGVTIPAFLKADFDWRIIYDIHNILPINKVNPLFAKLFLNGHYHESQAESISLRRAVVLRNCAVAEIERQVGNTQAMMLHLSSLYYLLARQQVGIPIFPMNGRHTHLWIRYRRGVRIQVYLWWDFSILGPDYAPKKVGGWNIFAQVKQQHIGHWKGSQVLVRDLSQKVLPFKTQELLSA